MATPKQLVAVIAKLTGVPEGTVIQHDRNLAVAGLRSEASRGRGKSSVTYQDAANLLIAVAGSRNVKDSAKTVREYSELKASEPLLFDNEPPRGLTFGDALAAMLEAVPADREAYGGPDGDTVDVSLFGPSPTARLEWKTRSGGDVIDYGEPWSRDRKPRPFADLTFAAVFSQATLGFVGELLKE